MIDLDIELPSNPGDLIRLAILDLLEIRERQGYSINMERWHSLIEPFDICEVCLAGAVMARTLHAPKNLNGFEFIALQETSLRIKKQLRALDYFRVGSWEKAFVMLEMEYPKKLGYQKVPEAYHMDAELFVIDMLDMAYNIDKAMETE